MIQPIILAAGKGTRMQSDTPKALHTFMGKPLIRWVIDALARTSSAKSPIIIVGHKSDVVRGELGATFTYVEQTDISGTASAIKACLPFLQDDDKVLILYGDQPLVQTNSIEKFAQALTQKPDALIMGIVSVPDYEEWRKPIEKYGRIQRGERGEILSTIEYKDATDEIRKILEVNPSVYCVQASWLKSAIPRITPSPVSGEYYLTDIVMLAVQDKKEIVPVYLTPEETLGVNCIEDAEFATQFLLSRNTSD